MPPESSAKHAPGIVRFGRGEKLSRIESIALIAIIGIMAVVDVVGVFTGGRGFDVIVWSVLTTVSFLLFLWSPSCATVTLAILFSLSFLIDKQGQVLIAAALAASLVIRLGGIRLILSYVAGFLVAIAIAAYVAATDPAQFGIYLILATVSGAVGLALRAAFARGSKLEQQLARSAEQEREAVLAERRWIAGELHDSIAHHLTVVALHVQMLDDPAVSADSQAAIRNAARKAMTDLRFVIELANDAPRASGVQTGDLAVAIDEAAGEFEDAGHGVTRVGDPRDERIPRVAEIILARIMRESATNVLKYAGQGGVEIALFIDDAAVTLNVDSPVPATPRRDLPSSKTGLTRMAERVLEASGEFTAGEIDGIWRVSARLPIG